jgi:C1A family cysteine protease
MNNSLRSYGWNPDLPDRRDIQYSFIFKVKKKLPESVDLRKLCSAVENQGNLGSCTAQALTSALEVQEKIQGKNVVDMSRLFVYYNERAMEGTVSQDSGAMIRDGIKSLVKQGCCTEDKWPYNIEKFRTKPKAECYADGLTHQVLAYQRLNSLNEMLSCLADGFPFVFGFSVYEGFESECVARTGKLEMPENSEKLIGGHAVLAVGFNSKNKRLIVRNSWGSDWGIKGYFTMPYNYVTDRNLSDDFWTIRSME